MSVFKFKPAQIPRIFEEFQQATADRTERAARATKQQLERSQKLLKQSHATLERSKSLNGAPKNSTKQKALRAKGGRSG